MSPERLQAGVHCTQSLPYNKLSQCSSCSPPVCPRLPPVTNRPGTWMSRGWLAHVPTGMPSLEYLALYDTLPAAANDPTAIQVGGRQGS